MPRYAPAVTAKAFSFSRIKTFQHCPKRYRFRYRDRLKEAFRSAESHLGSSVHEALEWLYEQRMVGASPEVEAVEARFAVAWEEGLDERVALVKRGQNYDELFAEGRFMIRRFYAETFQRDRSETLALEQRFSVELEGGIVFSGIADRIGRTHKGGLFVIDYKTSKREGDRDDEMSEALQAPLYASMAMREKGDLQALAGYCYLRHGSVSWQKVTQARAKILERRFVTLAKQAEMAESFPARPGILCAWCGFNARCDQAQVRSNFRGGLELARQLGDDQAPLLAVAGKP